jgi:hypothetical protein
MPVVPAHVYVQYLLSYWQLRIRAAELSAELNYGDTVAKELRMRLGPGPESVKALKLPDTRKDAQLHQQVARVSFVGCLFAQKAPDGGDAVWKPRDHTMMGTMGIPVCSCTQMQQEMSSCHI